MPKSSTKATGVQWQQVASSIKARREQLGLSQDEAVAASSPRVSRSVWSIAETAGQKTGSMADTSLRGICAALQWTPNSVYLILDGQEPQLLNPSRSDSDDGVLERLDEMQAALARIERSMSAALGQVPQLTEAVAREAREGRSNGERRAGS